MSEPAMTMNSANTNVMSAIGASRRAGAASTVHLRANGTAVTPAPGQSASERPGRFTQPLRRRRGGVSVILTVAGGIDDRARSSDEPAGGVRSKCRREVLDGPALGSDARQQEDRARHQLAQPLEQLRPRRARDGADARQTATRPTRACAELGHDAARATRGPGPRPSRGPARPPHLGSTSARARSNPPPLRPRPRRAARASRGRAAGSR